jgi:uncharacterized damage-inducible protein DinB
MKLTELYLDELDRESTLSRRALERVPEGRYDWKPHEKSMPMGYLSTLVATMLGWIDMMVNQEALDFAPKGGSGYKPQELRTTRELVQALDGAVAKARAALSGTTDEHLMTNWKLMAGGNLIVEQPRYLAIREGVFNHLAHHRGQLTVYLRLNDAPVPSIYGPTADEPLPGGPR